MPINRLGDGSEDGETDRKPKRDSAAARRFDEGFARAGFAIAEARRKIPEPEMLTIIDFNLQYPYGLVMVPTGQPVTLTPEQERFQAEFREREKARRILIDKILADMDKK